MIRKLCQFVVLLVMSPFVLLALGLCLTVDGLGRWLGCDHV